MSSRLRGHTLCSRIIEMPSPGTDRWIRPFRRIPSLGRRGESGNRYLCHARSVDTCGGVVDERGHDRLTACGPGQDCVTNPRDMDDHTVPESPSRLANPCRRGFGIESTAQYEGGDGTHG